MKCLVCEKEIRTLEHYARMHPGFSYEMAIKHEKIPTKNSLCKLGAIFTPKETIKKNKSAS